MAQQVIKGDNLMLFDSVGKSVAYATSHTLSINANTTDTKTKDHGVYGATEVQSISWEISSENLYTSKSYDALFDAMIRREAVTLFFGLKAQSDDDKTVVNDDYAFWSGSEKADAEASGVPATDKTQTGYTGKAFITSLVANANTGENATYSVTFSGNGKIARTNMPLVTSVKPSEDPTPDFD